MVVVVRIRESRSLRAATLEENQRRWKRKEVGGVMVGDCHMQRQSVVENEDRRCRESVAKKRVGCVEDDEIRAEIGFLGLYHVFSFFFDYWSAG